MLAETVRVSQRTLSFALHGAAGIILAVVGIELMPEALEADPPWVILSVIGDHAVTMTVAFLPLASRAFQIA